MTIPKTVSEALKRLQAAKCPEEIFGADLKAGYRAWAKICHEDTAPAKYKKHAHEAFVLLGKLHIFAVSKELAGTYGDNKPMVALTLATKTVTYNLNTVILSDEISETYSGTNSKGEDVWARICRNPVNNDLLKNEADILGSFPATLKNPKHVVFFPHLLDSFEAEKAKVRRRVNIFRPLSEGCVTYKDVRDVYKDGLDPRDATWMWNRLLEALHLLHTGGYCHGHVIPTSFYIVPESHLGILWDFAYAVKCYGNVKAISPEYKFYYPSEVFKKAAYNESSDVYMAANCMAFLLNYADAKIPKAIRDLIKACLIGRAHRIQSVGQVYADFKEITKKLWGPRKFRHFSMAATK